MSSYDSDDSILSQFSRLQRKSRLMHRAYLGAKIALVQPEIRVGVAMIQEFGTLLSAKALKFLAQEVSHRFKISA